MVDANKVHCLSNKWCLWFHLSSHTDWSITSYKKIYTFDTLEKCIPLIENIDKTIIEKSMLFLMKDNVKPIWEDMANKKGGSISYKIPIENIYNIWKKIVYYLIGNTLTDEYIMNNINGISVSPKKNFCIIKFWIGNIINLNECELYDFFKDTNKQLDYDPFNLDKLCGIEKQYPLLKLHETAY